MYSVQSYSILEKSRFLGLIKERRRAQNVFYIYRNVPIFYTELLSIPFGLVLNRKENIVPGVSGTWDF